MTPAADPDVWRQINLHLPPDPVQAEQAAFTGFLPALLAAEADGIVTGWFFIRKPWWRFRYHPGPGRAHEVNVNLHHTAQAMRERGRLRQWVDAIYEPEIHAFGGPAAMAAAHRLFHADSHHIARHLDAIGGSRREVGLLLCTALLRAAGHDRYERGDVWARVAEHRPLRTQPSPDQWDRIQPAVARLIATDTASTALRDGSLMALNTWLSAFEAAGRELRNLAQTGQLTRGARAVAAHHILFAFNRLGLSYTTQSILAHAAKAATFV